MGNFVRVGLVVLGGCALLLPARTADAESPVVTFPGLAAGEKVTIGRGTRIVKLALPPNMYQADCRVTQGTIDMEHHDVDLKAPTCNLSRDLEGADTLFRPGPARIEVRVYKTNPNPVPSGNKKGGNEPAGEAIVTTFPIELVAAAPQGGAGTRFDSGYWFNTGGGMGELELKDIVIKNGILSFRPVLGKVMTGTPVTGVIVDKDGIIQRQTVTLGPWTKVPGAKVFASDTEAATQWKTAVVSGTLQEKTSEGHPFDLHLQGPTVRAKVDNGDGTLSDASEGQTEYKLDIRCFRNGEEGIKVTWRSSSSTAAPGATAGAGTKACKDACFSAEHRCSTGRGACMKTRQACVASCR